MIKEENRLRLNSGELIEYRIKIKQLKNLDRVIKNNLTENEKKLYEAYVVNNEYNISKIHRDLFPDLAFSSVGQKITRLLRIIEMYDKYYDIDHDKLQLSLATNFTIYQVQLINHMKARMSCVEMSKILKKNYRTIGLECGNIFSILEKLGETERQLLEFLKTAKKFKKESPGD